MIIMRCYYPLLIVIVLSLLAQTGQAEEAGHELLWSYRIGYSIYGVSVSSDGSYIAAGSRDETVYLFNRDGELLWSNRTGGDVYGVSVSSDGSYIAAGSSDNKVYLFNREGELLWSYWTGGDVYGVSIPSDGLYLAAGSKDNKVYLFANLEGLFNSIEEAKKSVELERAKNFNMDEAETLLFRAEDAVSTGDYAKASELADEAKSKAESISNEAASAETTIDEAKSAILQERSKGFNMAEAETLLSKAEDAFSTGDYAKASELADEAKAMVESIVKEILAAENAINEAESVIHQEESKGFNPVEAESLLSQAEGTFNSGDYRRAGKLADEAMALALDIDQDGVSNDADFAPTINNYMIYVVATILLAGSAITLIIKRERVRREEEERLQKQVSEERERIRQEEERRRSMQEILDKIKEVT